jgi:hypothetical protein
MDVLNKLFSSRRFWLAVTAIVLNVLSVGFGIKPEIISAINLFAGALIAAYTVDDTAAALKG